MAGPGSGQLSPRTEKFIETHGLIWFVWALLVALSFMAEGGSVLSGGLYGNDDYMRMVQIRDWLGGQAWNDLAQYRLFPSEPLISHWARLSDILVGGPISLLTPFIGAPAAEITASIVVPSALLLAMLYLCAALTQKLTTSKMAVIAAMVMAGLSLPTLIQYQIGRIDHHGVAIIIALLIMLCLTAKSRLRLSAALAGTLSGFALYVGIESAPVVAAAAICAGLFWVLGEDQGAARMRAFGLALAVTSAAIFYLTVPPARFGLAVCDALSPVYVQLAIGIGAALFCLSFAGRWLTSPWPRFFAAALLGSGALAGCIALYPNCLHGPYANVDPRLAEIWLSNVTEAATFWGYLTKNPVGGLLAIYLPVLSLIAWLIWAVQKRGALLPAPRCFMIFTGLTLLAGLVQFRVMSFTTALAVPLAAWALASVLDKCETLPKRSQIWGRLGAIIALAPITLPLLFGSLYTPAKDAEQAAAQRSEKIPCDTPQALRALDAFPAGLMITQIDLGAPLLHATSHSATAAPYHRNTAGITASFDVFLNSPEKARIAANALKADYVLACKDFNETRLYQKHAPDGLLARLIAGEVPTWLLPLPVEDHPDLMLYKLQ